jgi:hypothetical protein
MKRFEAKRFRVLNATRFLVVALLIIGTLAGLVSLQSVSASTTCRLACCAKRAAHTGVSCAGGTCHAALKRNRRPTRPRLTSSGADLCGVTRKLETKTRPRAYWSNTGTESVQAEAALGNPCPPECSGTLPNSNSQRNSATISGPVEMGPANLQHIRFASTNARVCEISYRKYAPRGPPVLS